ncbi:5'-methylthioadenosine/adenosylhomocysteine nucleosidase [Piscinibacter sp. HJYY11]|uniref:5'-methylthioadenosine/adenosylhomocysteine nucleosidase n=1 Tax=Piscinibacter sp. HJYY11 TaxID=2801333 RepID=UPI00191D3F5A|nr:5'-methylthioadenosine/adenosylhomocysteine nucleosidase [Piscinibacter sp. HJYY11]MBL0730097.1 5'-methylthioadenosine/adenosylhomocysteine nucleosidase [Piscinibacter sp. HJYY11]
MKRIAIVGAMHEELRALLDAMPDERPVLRAGREFWVGHLAGQEVVVVLSRIGKVAAATTAALLLSEFDVSRIVFTGTAGGLAPGVNVGDVVVADALLQHDMDASPLFPRHEVPLYGRARFATDATMSAGLAQASRTMLADLGAPQARVHCGLVVSGDRFVSERAENDALCARLPDALAVEMEGAALAQVCHDFGVPFAVVRTVSDRADDHAHVDFNRFVAEVASRYTLGLVQHYLDKLPAP